MHERAAGRNAKVGEATETEARFIRRISLVVGAVNGDCDGSDDDLPVGRVEGGARSTCSAMAHRTG